MGAEVDADQLGDEWKGYVLRVAGGNDKQGFPMKQGVLTNSEYHSSSVYTFTLRHNPYFPQWIHLNHHVIFVLVCWSVNFDYLKPP